ncbi:hypothetical protein L7F22_004393 [Adiantum nelumboides]|nr:hypothetical protein [Adiantum nelumboides]
MLLLLLELLEGTTIFLTASMVNNALDSMAHRSKMPGSSSMQNPHLAARMHRALCLKAAILRVLIHVPQQSVEFVLRSINTSFPMSSNVYHVRISETPSCTCPDFVRGTGAGYGFRPCKHLFYIYMVQLSIEKDLEHLMFQAELMEEDLERILSGFY